MTTFELVLTILGALLLAGGLADLISWLTLIKEQNTSPVFALWWMILFVIMAGSFLIRCITVENSLKLYYAMLTVCVLTAIPASSGIVITDKGICTILFGFRRYTLPGSVEYKYIGKNLELHFKKQRRFFNLNIKNIKTVKLLADWYPKSGYVNPLISNNDQN
ncbi:MAG: hypothetical protein IJK31_10850 [Ruminococcus sp.]|nr:hypothetical protein [Ruminococcus sp.]